MLPIFIFIIIVICFFVFLLTQQSKRKSGNNQAAGIVEQIAQQNGLIKCEYGPWIRLRIPEDTQDAEGHHRVERGPNAPFLRYMGPHGPATLTIGDSQNGSSIYGPNIPTIALLPVFQKIATNPPVRSGLRLDNSLQEFAAAPLTVPFGPTGNDQFIISWPSNGSATAGVPITFSYQHAIYTLTGSYESNSTGYWQLTRPDGIILGIGIPIELSTQYINPNISESEILMLLVALLAGLVNCVDPQLAQSGFRGQMI